MARAALRADLSLTSTAFDNGLRRSENLIRGFARRAAQVGVISLALNTAGLTASVGSIAQFEDSMARVRALTDATTQQVAALNTTAQGLGATTRFSAREAAEGMGFLAQAGFDSNQIIAETGNVLNLAAAGALELGRAADIASNVFTPFQARGTRLLEVVDTLSQTARSTNTNVEQLGVAMRQVAPVAAQMGISVQETAGALGALGNAGIQAESGGTALRNILLRLVNPTSEIRKGMDTLGLSMRDLDPTSQTLVEIFDKVAAAQRNLGNEALAAQANVQIFGVRSAAASSILASTVRDVERFAEANRVAEGTAASVAKTMTDSLGGALDALGSRFQAVVLTINESEFGTELRRFIEDITEALADFNADGASEFGERLAQAFNTAKAAAGPVADVLQDIPPIVSRLLERASELGNFISENRDDIAAWGRALTVAGGALIGIKFAQLIGGILQTSKAIASSTAANVLAAGQYVRTQAAAVTSSIAQIGANNAVAASHGRVAAAATSAAAAQRVAAGSRLIAFSQLPTALQGSVRNLIATSGKTGTSSAQAFITNFSSGIVGTTRLATSIAKLGGSVFAGIAAWEIGTFIGRQIDDAFQLSDRGAQAIAQLTNDVASKAELTGRDGPVTEALSIRRSLADSRSLTAQQEQRTRAADLSTRLHGEIADLILEGAHATDTEVTSRRNALKILDQLATKSREDLTARIGSAKILANLDAARAANELSRQKRDQAAWEKILATRQDFADTAIASAQDLANTNKLVEDTTAIAENLGTSTLQARLLSQALSSAGSASVNASTKTLEEYTEARREVEETFRILRAQAGIDTINVSAALSEIQSGTQRLANTPLDDSALREQLTELDALVQRIGQAQPGSNLSTDLQNAVSIANKLSLEISGTSASGILNDITTFRSGLTRALQQAASVLAGIGEEDLDRVARSLDTIISQAAEIQLNPEGSAQLVTALDRARTIAEGIRTGDLGAQEALNAIAEVKTLAAEIRAPNLIEDIVRVREQLTNLTLDLEGNSAEELENLKELRTIAIKLQRDLGIGQRESLALAKQELDLKRQAAEVENEALRNEGREDILAEIASARAKLTESTADDRALEVDRRRAEIVQKLTEDYKIPYDQALLRANELLRVEEQISQQTVARARQSLADQLRLASAEAGESGEDPEAVRRRQRINQLSQEFQREQQLSQRQAVAAAKELVRLEELKNARQSQGERRPRNGGIINLPFSTGPVGSSRVVGRGSRDSGIGSLDFSNSGIRSFGNNLARGFTDRTRGMVNALSSSADLSKTAARTQSNIQQTTLQRATQAGTQDGTELTNQQLSPLQILVKIAQKTEQNTADTVTELASLRELITTT